MSLSRLPSLIKDRFSTKPIEDTPRPLILEPESRSLLEAEFYELWIGLERGRFTSVDLVKAYIERIGQVNDRLRVVTQINPDAIKIAQELDEKRFALPEEARASLYGIPILLKENIATHDQMQTTAGSLALVDARPPRDSTIAAKLREAGAVILGKTNMTEWANFRSHPSDSGWSACGGQTLGPFHADQDPSGSSSGSGVAPTLGLCFAAIGTETDGSIIFPAAFNNIVGIKPTVGLTSRHLVIPVSDTQDTVGPMARTVRDAAYVLQAIVGSDGRDERGSAIPATLSNYVTACRHDGLTLKRIGVPWNVIKEQDEPVHPAVLGTFKQALKTMSNAGATIVKTKFLAHKELRKSKHVDEKNVFRSEFKAGVADYLSQLDENPTGAKTLQDLQDFTKSRKSEEFESRGFELWDDSVNLGWDAGSPQHAAALKKNAYYGGEGGVLGALERDKLDAIVLPTTLASGPCAIVGSPAISVPLGFYPEGTKVKRNETGRLVDIGPGVPFGISFLGRRFDEATLITLAYAFEQRTHVRLRGRPLVVPTAEVALQAPQRSLGMAYEA